jgi:hypothetical protein
MKESTMKKKIIHVNQHNIRFNSKNGLVKPVFTVKEGKKNTYSNEVKVNCSCGKEAVKIVYSPDKPLSCGGKVWIESKSEVICENPMTYQETKNLCKTKK